MHFYQKSLEELLAHYHSNRTTGLTTDQVTKHRNHYGPNKEAKAAHLSLKSFLFEQLTDPMALLLMGSGIIIYLSGSHLDAFIVLGILCVNTTVGGLHEYKIDHLIKKLKTFHKRTSLVIRAGNKTIIPDTQLVPGDIVIIHAGDRIAADMRIIESYDITTDESVLTGESNPVKKYAGTLHQETPLYHQTNMLFLGSYALSGYAHGLVVATGSATHAGTLYALSQEQTIELPLEKDLANLLRLILWSIVVICAGLLIIGLIHHIPFAQLLAALVALFICVVPQGLPVIMTLILALGAYVMAKKHIFAKRLAAVDALGRANVIIFDKTGTLTRNQLTVCSLFADAHYAVSGDGYASTGTITHNNTIINTTNMTDQLKKMLIGGLLLDRSQLTYNSTSQKYHIKGSQNEAAIMLCAQKANLTLDAIKHAYTHIYEIPFHAEHRFHAAFYEHNNTGILFIMGAPETIMRTCLSINSATKKAIDAISCDTMRMLASAYKEFNLADIPAASNQKKLFFTELLTHHLTFLGIFGMQDELRADAHALVSTMQHAGIQVIMATGDTLTTASHIAQTVGILKSDQMVMGGEVMRTLSDQELRDTLTAYHVYARMLPADKLRLVKLLQQQGNIVGMIGDGINDVPSLAAANIGIAMGTAASDRAQEEADIILLDDSLSSVIAGIRQGRHIFYTFKRVTLYFFTTNFAEILVMLCSLAGGYKLPLLASQILWLNLVTDGFLDTALAFEKEEDTLLNASWFTNYPALITQKLVMRIVYMAAVAGLFSFSFFIGYLPEGILKARTMCMVALTICQVAAALNCRSFKKSLFTLHPRNNHWLFIAIAGVIGLLIALLYIPFLQHIFNTTPLLLRDWILVIATGLVVIFIEELRKKICS